MAIGNSMRLVYMFVHFALFVAAYTYAMIQISSIVIFIIGIVSGVAFVIYVPAAFYLTLRKRYTIWDRAFGEVTYILIQTVIWLILSVLSALTLAHSFCGDEPRNRVFYFDDWTESRSSDEWCPSVRSFSAMAWTHFGILFGWAIYSIVTVVTSRHNTNKAWGSSMTALMEGDCACHGGVRGRRASEKGLVTDAQIETP